MLTAVEEKAEIVFVLMNDHGYGVIRNIQDAQYRSRYAYSALHTPDFAQLAASFGLPHQRVARVEDFAAALDARARRSRTAADRGRHGGHRAVRQKLQRTAGRRRRERDVTEREVT